jgi:gas vesicle protein
MARNKKTGEKIVFGTLVAATVGYVVGLLTAPKSGKETREQIKDTSVKAIKEAETELKDLYKELSEAVKMSEGKLKVVSAKGKTEAKKYLDEANTAMENVKTMLTALREGDAEDPDLKKAIKQANNAKDHLVAYFKNSQK